MNRTLAIIELEAFARRPSRAPKSRAKAREPEVTALLIGPEEFA